ncbi:hypothetical protein ETA_26740 [Erwinia tasmaniensis Et1/99]|uniref:Uncharacterized protein n=1 Tax=Erwinia tasmaniensis (strain DSM 17950 / CFBP 7177 / CIP 109463 / NCPPB 4357 / Et1/99) TaxID=465817 RepID=B2VG31_ERWT9|nr:hypothetical protein ETA_26740 [Erwinia tasmaniensis Et1/99]
MRGGDAAAVRIFTFGSTVRHFKFIDNIRRFSSLVERFLQIGTLSPLTCRMFCHSIGQPETKKDPCQVINSGAGYARQ